MTTELRGDKAMANTQDIEEQIIQEAPELLHDPVAFDRAVYDRTLSIEADRRRRRRQSMTNQ